MPFTLEAIINNPEMDKNIIKLIDEHVDNEDYGDNVKAQMTKGNLIDKDGFKELVDIVKNLSVLASEIKYKTKINPFVKYMWGVRYKSFNHTLPHDHFPATWACAYYINPPKNSPGLYFPEDNVEIEIQHGKLIMFEGNVLHEVKKKQFEGLRYVVSANINDISFVD